MHGLFFFCYNDSITMPLSSENKTLIFLSILFLVLFGVAGWIAFKSVSPWNPTTPMPSPAESVDVQAGLAQSQLATLLRKKLGALPSLDTIQEIGVEAFPSEFQKLILSGAQLVKTWKGVYGQNAAYQAHFLLAMNVRDAYTNHLILIRQQKDWKVIEAFRANFAGLYEIETAQKRLIISYVEAQLGHTEVTIVIVAK